MQIEKDKFSPLFHLPDINMKIICQFILFFLLLFGISIIGNCQKHTPNTYHLKSNAFKIKKTDSGYGDSNRARKEKYKTERIIERIQSITEPSYCDGGRTRKEIIDTVVVYIPKFKEKYKNRLLINKNLAGKLLIKIDVLKNGNVKNATILFQSTNDSLLNNEIIQVVKSIKFSESPVPCDTLLTFEYPFTFSNDKIPKINSQKTGDSSISGLFDGLIK